MDCENMVQYYSNYIQVYYTILPQKAMVQNKRAVVYILMAMVMTNCLMIHLHSLSSVKIDKIQILKQNSMYRICD